MGQNFGLVSFIIWSLPPVSSGIITCTDTLQLCEISKGYSLRKVSRKTYQTIKVSHLAEVLYLLAPAMLEPRKILRGLLYYLKQFLPLHISLLEHGSGALEGSRWKRDIKLTVWLLVTPAVFSSNAPRPCSGKRLWRDKKYFTSYRKPLKFTQSVLVSGEARRHTASETSLSLMDRQEFLNTLLLLYPLDILDSCWIPVHATMPKEIGGKDEGTKEKNAKFWPIVQIHTHWAQ